MKSVTAILLFVVFALAISLAIRGSEVITAFTISATNTTVATVNITNNAPTCGGLLCYDDDADQTDINLVAGTTRRVYCTGICNDANGWGNIINYTGQMSNVSSADCTADFNNCYTNTTCQNKSSVNTTAMNMECTYLFWFHAGNTSKTGDWTGRLKAGDGAGEMSVAATDLIDVAELLAIGVDSTLAFGTGSAGANDTTLPHDLTIFNYGNMGIDFQVNGTAFSCTSGTIAAEYMKVNLSTGTSYSNAYPLTGTLGNDAFLKTFDLGKSATASGSVVATNKETYWGLGVPVAVGGNCQATVWFAAVAA